MQTDPGKKEIIIFYINSTEKSTYRVYVEFLQDVYKVSTECLCIMYPLYRNSVYILFKVYINSIYRIFCRISIKSHHFFFIWGEITCAQTAWVSAHHKSMRGVHAIVLIVRFFSLSNVQIIITKLKVLMSLQPISKPIFMAWSLKNLIKSTKIWIGFNDSQGWSIDFYGENNKKNPR